MHKMLCFLLLLFCSSIPGHCASLNLGSGRELGPERNQVPIGEEEVISTDGDWDGGSIPNPRSIQMDGMRKEHGDKEASTPQRARGDKPGPRSTRLRRAVQQIPPDVSSPVISNVVVDLSGTTPPTPTITNSTGNETQGNGTLNSTVESRAGGLPIRLDCYYPVLDPVSAVPQLKYELSDKPPCLILGLDEDEPIPYANYKGLRGYDEECHLHHEVNDEQIKGYSPAGGYQTTTNVYDKDEEGSPDHTLNRKVSKVEEFTCRRDLFLECYPTVPDYLNDDGDFVGGTGVCKCMAAFGRDVDSRLVINGQCYIPAEMGRHSECITEDTGLPLPSGDALYEPQTWNAIRLPCTPNSTCEAHHYWIEKRCKCVKYFFAEANGTGKCRDTNRTSEKVQSSGEAVLVCFILLASLSTILF